MSVAIKKCKCPHEFQDKTYGKGMRVKNKTQTGWRCTVCSEHEVSKEKKS